MESLRDRDVYKRESMMTVIDGNDDRDGDGDDMMPRWLG